MKDNLDSSSPAPQPTRAGES